jgi:ataxia telangiectasia mutated family protein
VVSFSYIFNLVGQFIGYPSLQDQCCSIASCLLDLFKSNPAKEIVSVLGDQLQFLVSKLVTCCIDAEADTKISGAKSSQLVNLLHKLVVSSDSSLNEDIRVGVLRLKLPSFCPTSARNNREIYMF